MPTPETSAPTPDEQWLIEEVSQGRSVDGRTRTGDARLAVRASTIRQLVLLARRPTGLRVSGLAITGPLDLVYAQIQGPVAIIDCEFTDGLDCRYTTAIALMLHDCTFEDLRCDGMRLEHDLRLEGSRTQYVSLQDAQVGGLLRLSGTTLTGRHGVALSGDRIRVAGGVFCENGFVTTGEVWFAGAVIGGQFRLTGATLSNPGGKALVADRFRVASGVFCQAGFRAAGEVRLPGANIGGQLNLNGGTFDNPDGIALNADGIRVAGGVFCQAGFHATGEARMLMATVEATVNLAGGRFENPSGDALAADGIRVAGNLACTDGFNALGTVSLLGADIQGQVVLGGGRFSKPDGIAISADRIRVGGGLFCQDGFSATGQVRLSGATIRGQLDLGGGRFSNPGASALAVQRAEIGTLLMTELSSESSGDCNLLGSHVGYLEDRFDAWARFTELALLDLTYDRINYRNWSTDQRLAWLRKTGTHQNQPYEQLAATLRAQGHERDARRVLIAKHKQQRRQQPWGARLPGFLFDSLLGYGYRPLQRTLPLLLALYLIGAFWLLPQARDHHAVIATRPPVHTTPSAAATNGQPPQPIVATSHCPIDYPCFSPRAYAADVVIPLVNTRQTDYWAVIDYDNPLTTWYVRLAPALGWILSTAAALGFTGLIRRE